MPPATYGPGSGPVWLNYLQCTGNEDHLLQCYSQYPVSSNVKEHNYDAGVMCHSEAGKRN